jgi:hypothetical protein
VSGNAGVEATTLSKDQTGQIHQAAFTIDRTSSPVSSSRTKSKPATLMIKSMWSSTNRSASSIAEARRPSTLTVRLGAAMPKLATAGFDGA